MNKTRLETENLRRLLVAAEKCYHAAAAAWHTAEARLHMSLEHGMEPTCEAAAVELEAADGLELADIALKAVDRRLKAAEKRLAADADAEGGFNVRAA